MRIRHPRDINLGIMSDDARIWNDPLQKHKCDDPDCDHKITKEPRLDELSKVFEDKNKNGIPDVLEGKRFNNFQNSFKKKVKKWI